MTEINEFTPDEKIIRRVLKGNLDCFRIIIERYENHIFSIGMRFFKNVDDSYDFTQDVFIKSFESISSYRGRAPFKYWLVKVAYNTGINKIRKSRDSYELVEEYIESSDATPEVSLLKTEVHDALNDAVSQLDEKYKICVDLYFFLGIPYSEISEITGYPVNTIKSNVFRAKSILRDKLKGTVAEEYNEV